MLKSELVKLAEEGKLKINKYWYNSHFRYGAKTDDMAKNESYRINAKDFNEFIKLDCEFFNSK